MSTATLKRRKKRPQKTGSFANSLLDEDRSQAFFMPASMSLEEFRKWSQSDEFPDRGCITFLGKEIFIDMSAERPYSHGSVKVEICTVLGNLVRKRKSGKLFFDRTRFVHPTAEVSNEPDAFYAAWDTIKKGALRNVATADGEDVIELEGTPDWIMEIISPSSVTKDKKKLRKSYHRAGVPEYWLIDARGADVEFDILIRGEDNYEPAEVVRGWQVSKAFGKRFRLRRVVDPTGEPDYRLQMK